MDELKNLAEMAKSLQAEIDRLLASNGNGHQDSQPAPEPITALQQLEAAYKRANWVILDTETTGLDRGEIVQISIVGMDGKPLLNTLVKPVRSIPHDAQRIHGITDEMCAKAPGWREIAPLALLAIQGKDLLVYNATYDRKMMHQAGEAAGMTKIEWREAANWVCVMEAYAEFHGEWSDYRQSFKWQKLTDAAWRLGVERKDAHSAFGDCVMTQGVFLALAKVLDWKTA